MRTIYILLLSTLDYHVFSQENVIIDYNDTLHLGFVQRTEDVNEIDSLYFFSDIDLNKKCYKVYYDNTENLLLSQTQYGDTSIVLQYYRNGQLFRKDIALNGIELIYEERWCKNGQLVRKVDYSEEEMHISNIYCNGNKKNEFILIGIFPEGVFQSWYENGQLKEIGEYKDGDKIGVWKYYDENGNLIKEEKY